MSASCYFNADFLNARSQGLKPGVKKSVKTGLSRAQRQMAKKQLAGEVQTLVVPNASRDLRDLTAAELEDYADFLLQDSRPEDGFGVDDGSDDLSMEFFADELQGVSNVLEGSLPDWMLVQIEDANGNAFALLSLFEAKSPSPKAAISMDDEVMYA